MTFAFASLVTHSLFRTNPQKQWVNDTTSYLDLSPLYGANQVEQDSVRDKGQGRGLLYNDCYAEERLGFLPAAAGALLVIFCRNHNVRLDPFILEHVMLMDGAVHRADAPLDQREGHMVRPAAC